MHRATIFHSFELRRCKIRHSQLPRQFHLNYITMPSRDVVSWTAMLMAYAYNGEISKAREVFEQMPKRNAASWNAMISAYARDPKLLKESYELFYAMPNKNSVTHAAMITGFSRQAFEAMPVKDVISWTSMLMGFSKRGWTEKSISLFELMPQKDDVSWTAIISGLVHNGKLEIACQWFSNKTVKVEIKLNPLVISSMLSVLASLTILKEGMQMHACVVKMGLDSDIFILSSLISMYSKCGNLSEACQIFSSIRTTNIVTINSMITAFAQHGLTQEAFDLFRKLQAGGQMPNKITFLAILTACSRSGLVEEGNHYFNSMRSVHGIEPGPDHYTCMVDLFGRAGLLQEALNLINSIPDGPHSVAWGALLSVTGQHSNCNLAKFASHKFFELEPENAMPYADLLVIDWVTHKLAADTLVELASYSGPLITNETSPIIESLGACCFDKVKPVRDSMMEALQVWKKISNKGDTAVPKISMERKVANFGNIENKIFDPEICRLQQSLFQ